jgi:diguanylate cyclase (GGDEF)-like protein
MQAADFESRLKAQVDFPSPSRVASEIVALARNPDVEMSRVATAVGRDPAISAKILRIANSAFYAQRRPSQNLRQALVIIGLNAALTLALSFSLVSAMRALRPTGIDYKRFWRRSLLAATAARAFGEVSKAANEDDLFLAGLLQDMAVLAIDRVHRDFYKDLSLMSSHPDWVAYELERLGRDHSFYTALMLRSWNLPERICKGIEYSHEPEQLDVKADDGKFARCLSLGGDLADATLAADRAEAVRTLARRATSMLGLNDEQFASVVDRTRKMIPEMEQLYETIIIDSDDADGLLAEARELLAVRNLHAIREVTALQATTSVLLSKTEELEDSSRRDPLTGALNRLWLERLLDTEFTQASVFGRPLSIAYVDVDRFRLINEKYGQQVGDDLLRACAQTLQRCVRGSDMIARYAGEEFMVVLSGTDQPIARQVGDRILSAIRAIVHPDHPTARITVSIGIATCTTQQRFAGLAAYLEAADHALYAAKLRGRDRLEAFEELARTTRQVVGERTSH